MRSVAGWRGCDGAVAGLDRLPYQWPRTLDSRLAESEHRLRLAVRAAEIGIWDWDLETDEMNYSTRAREICGLPSDGPVTLAMVRAVTHPEDLPWTSALARRSLDPQTRERQPYEYRIVRADTGEVRWVIAIGEAIFAEAGGKTRATRYLGTIQDITERKRTEQRLIESEARLRLAIDAARMAVWEVDLATDTLRASAELNAIFGFPPDASPTIEDLRACYAPGERERVTAAGRAALKAGRSDFEIEFECLRRDGIRRWMLLRAQVIVGADGRYERAIGVVMDVDERRRAMERQELLVAELKHRVKNTLQVVQSMVVQSFRDHAGLSESIEQCRSRIGALAAANDAIFREDGSPVPLAALVAAITDPYRTGGDGPFEVAGADVVLPSAAAVPLAMVLHELCTNAVKYGALSCEAGRVEIGWGPPANGVVTLVWTECGGPPVEPPERNGFGTRLLRSGLTGPLGTVDLAFEQSGVACTVRLRIG
jgi:PAS domain S-box-containing protein